MGPIRGLKRKKKTDKDVDYFAPGPSPLSPPCPSDWWSDDFSQRITGSSGDKIAFESVFNFSRRTFNYICSLVHDKMMSKNPNLRDRSGKTLSLNDQVAVALRRLGSGESLSTLGNSFRIQQGVISQVTWCFVEAMEENGLHHLQWPSTEEETRRIKERFESIRGLPNCLGAIDTTHVVFCQSSSDTSSKIWCDSEKNHSMVLQAIVGPTMRFLDVFAGWPGSFTDSQILERSTLFRLSEDGKRLNDKNLKLPDGSEIREYIVGDSGFPLLPWLLTPFQGRGLSEHRSEFNKRHYATRKVAQRALARLKDRWRIIQGMMWRPDKHKLPRIMLVCCILHNILIDLDDEFLSEAILSHNHDADYRQQSGNGSNELGLVQREKLALFLSGKLTPE